MRLIFGDERGYAMAALLVAMAVMAVMMSVILPVWSTMARREREAELVFRGEQYARAISLFQRKYGNATPPSLDVLLNERFLRKKYKDPITGEDFQLLAVGAALPGQAPTPPGREGAPPGRGAQPSPRGGGLPELPTPGRGAQPAGVAGGISGGGIMGVTSKSTEKSLRLYNGRDTYNQWVFLGIQQSTRAGGPPGTQTPLGGRGGPPGSLGPGGLPPAGRGPAGRGPGGAGGSGTGPPGRGQGLPPLSPPGGGRGFRPGAP